MTFLKEKIEIINHIHNKLLVKSKNYDKILCNRVLIKWLQNISYIKIFTNLTLNNIFIKKKIKSEFQKIEVNEKI